MHKEKEVLRGRGLPFRINICRNFTLCLKLGADCLNQRPFCILLQMFCKEALQLIKGNGILSAAVIQIGVNGTRNDQQFFVVRVLAVLCHSRVCVLRKVAGMRLLPVHDQHSASNLITVLQDGLIQERFAADHVPAAVGVEAAGMIAPFGLVVIIIILYEKRCILR